MNTTSGISETWVKSTQLVKQWELIRDEILLHKWYESEKAGQDIGWEKAKLDWFRRYSRERMKK